MVDNGSPFFDPFSAAEGVSTEIIEAILEEGGRLLYESYIDRKSYTFASDTISKNLVSELRMCFVPYDDGPLLRNIAQTSQESPTSQAASAPQAVAAQATEGNIADSITANALVDARNPEKSPSAFAESPAAGEPPVAPDMPSIADAAASGWTLEDEPPRCQIDTWARACVPVRKKAARPKFGPDKTNKKQKANVPVSASPVGSRSPSRGGVPGATGVEQPEARPMNSGRPQMIPLVDDREEDEEEAVLRDMKDREARRRRDEETRLQRKVADEAAEAAKLAQVKDQMKNKPHTYDSGGNIIWVQPPAVHKLPSSNLVPSFACKKAVAPGEDELVKRAPARLTLKKNPNIRKGKESEFTDGCKKFASQQPTMMEVMMVAPGVQLTERGANKSGGDLNADRNGKQVMTRKEYENMTLRGSAPDDFQSGGTPREGDQASAPVSRGVSQKELAGPTNAVPVEDDVEVKRASSSRRGSVSGAVTPRPGESVLNAAGPSQQRFQVVRGPDLGKDLVPFAPSTPRPVQAIAASLRRNQLKRDALGFNLSSRERAPTGTGSRFPSCAAQPPLGATMGHGLHTAGLKYEEYYFPNDQGQNVGDENESALAPTPTDTPRGMEGAIVNKNPDLARRLFAR